MFAVGDECAKQKRGVWERARCANGPQKVRSTGDDTYYMAEHLAEMVYGEKEHSDWFPQRSEFYYTNR